MRTHEIIERFDELTYRDYVIKTRFKKVRFDELRTDPWVDNSYLVVRRRGRTVAKFDAGIYYPLGNLTDAGFVSLLNDGNQQLVISQSSFRTGVQWVADFSKGFKIIFDGQKFNVGREGDDMTISDFDADGVYEITAPITTFYGFEGWRLTTGETPLPDIIFKYDSRQREYLPANPRFKECLLKEIEASESRAKSSGQLGRLMSVVLDYIFAGEEMRGWKFFEENCRLLDKATIKRDMLKELKGHPVYQYLQRSERRRVAIRKIDFANFSYPADPIYRKRGFRLKDGGYDGHRMPLAVAPWGPAPIGLVAIAYGDVSGDGIEDAMVVLNESVHGTAIPYYIYIYEMKGNRVRLLWAVETGDRAEGGLRKVYAEDGRLAIELYGNGARVNERLYGTNSSACCPQSFTRTRYRWAKNHFIRRGESEIIPLGDTNAALEMEYREPY